MFRGRNVQAEKLQDLIHALRFGRTGLRFLLQPFLLGRDIVACLFDLRLQLRDLLL